MLNTQESRETTHILKITLAAAKPGAP